MTLFVFKRRGFFIFRSMNTYRFIAEFRAVIFTLPLFFLCCCTGQSVVDNKMADSDNIIIDPVEMIPFHVYQQNVFVRLPDSLGGKGTEGGMVLDLYINRKAMIDSFVITKLSTSHNGRSVIDYYIAQPMNTDVWRFYPFISEYLKKEVKIKKVPGVDPDEITRMNLVVRFK